MSSEPQGGLNIEVKAFTFELEVPIHVKKLIEGVVDFLQGNDKLLGEHLWKIADLLDAADEKITNNQIPREESHELVYLIRFAKARAVRITQKRPELSYIFDMALPEVAHRLREADFLIDPGPHSTIENITFSISSAPPRRGPCCPMARNP